MYLWGLSKQYIIVKYRHALLIVFLIIIADQALKFFIKTHFYYGEEVNVFGHWFRLHFIENEGMAFGMQLGGADIGKLILTLFRLVAVTIGFFILKRFVDKGYGRGLIICGALILAGALGNLIDSMFYGLIFSESPYYYTFGPHGSMQPHVAHLTSFGHGYGKFLHGKVVDMLYFPIIETQSVVPSKVPFFGGRNFVFFEPVFNIADAAISIGVLILVFFQKRLVHKKVSKPVMAQEQHG